MYLLAFAIGIVAGLRTMTAPTAVAWAAWLGRLPVGGTLFAFMGYPWTPWVLTLGALGEFVADMLPATPSRKQPGPFIARIVSGAVSGATIGAANGAMAGGIVAGALGAVAGTLGGYACRMRLAAAFGQDRPAALIEDAVAIGGALLVVLAPTLHF